MTLCALPLTCWKVRFTLASDEPDERGVFT